MIICSRFFPISANRYPKQRQTLTKEHCGEREELDLAVTSI